VDLFYEERGIGPNLSVGYRYALSVVSAIGGNNRWVGSGIRRHRM
jgi:hypothetical protein